MLAKKIQKHHKKKEFFEVYRVLWVLEFVETDLEDQHLRIKIFYIYKVYPAVVIWGVWFLLLPGSVSASSIEKYFAFPFLSPVHPEFHSECPIPISAQELEHGKKAPRLTQSSGKQPGQSCSLVLFTWCTWLLQDLAAPLAAMATTHSRSQREWGTWHKDLEISPGQFPSSQIIINSQYDSSKLGAIAVPTLGWGFSFCASCSPESPRSAGSNHKYRAKLWIPAYSRQAPAGNRPLPRAGFSQQRFLILTEVMAWLCGCTRSVCGQEFPAGTTDTIQTSITSICSWKLALLLVTAASDSSPLGAKGQKCSVATDSDYKSICCCPCLRICLGFLIFFYCFFKKNIKATEEKAKQGFCTMWLPPPMSQKSPAHSWEQLCQHLPQSGWTRQA